MTIYTGLLRWCALAVALMWSVAAGAYQQGEEIVLDSGPWPVYQVLYLEQGDVSASRPCRQFLAATRQYQHGISEESCVELAEWASNFISKGVSHTTLPVGFPLVVPSASSAAIQAFETWQSDPFMRVSDGEALRAELIKKLTPLANLYLEVTNRISNIRRQISGMENISAADVRVILTEVGLIDLSGQVVGASRDELALVQGALRSLADSLDGRMTATARAVVADIQAGLNDRLTSVEDGLDNLSTVVSGLKVALDGKASNEVVSELAKDMGNLSRLVESILSTLPGAKPTNPTVSFWDTPYLKYVAYWAGVAVLVLIAIWLGIREWRLGKSKRQQKSETPSAKLDPVPVAPKAETQPKGDQTAKPVAHNTNIVVSKGWTVDDIRWESVTDLKDVKLNDGPVTWSVKLPDGQHHEIVFKRISRPGQGTGPWFAVDGVYRDADQTGKTEPVKFKSTEALKSMITRAANEGRLLPKAKAPDDQVAA